jgi:NAD+ synthase (glutamine-hydrolysing)
VCAWARAWAAIPTDLVNRYSCLLLNTSKKIDSAMGYRTLYGDIAGALCPIADLNKPFVYALGRRTRVARSVIPA